MYFQGFPVVPLAHTGFTGHHDIREEVHLDNPHAGTLAGLTAPTFDVE